MTLDLNHGNNNGSSKVYDSMENHDFTETGTLTFVEGPDGYVQNGGLGTNYLSTASPTGLFDTNYVTIASKFMPFDNWNNNSRDVLWDAAGTRYGFNRRNVAENNSLYIYLGGTNYIVATSTYAPYWMEDRKNIVVVQGTAGAPGSISVWLNNVKIVNNAAMTWSQGNPTTFYTIANASIGLNGQLYYVKIWDTLLPQADIDIIFADRINYMVTSTVNYMLTSTVKYQR